MNEYSPVCNVEKQRSVRYLRLIILDDVTFVEDDVVPSDRTEKVDVISDEVVRRYHHEIVELLTFPSHHELRLETLPFRGRA